MFVAAIVGKEYPRPLNVSIVPAFWKFHDLLEALARFFQPVIYVPASRERNSSASQMASMPIAALMPV